MIDWDDLPLVKKKKEILIGKLNVSEAYARIREPIKNDLLCQAGMRAWHKEEMEMIKKDLAILQSVYDSLSNEEIQFIKDEIDECCSAWGFEIVKDKPSFAPDYTKEDDDCLFDLYINQTVNGGYTGDEFAGDIYIELIPNKKYLKWSYCM